MTVDPSVVLEAWPREQLISEVRRLREELTFAVEQHDMWKQQWTEMRDTMWKPAMDKLSRFELLADIYEKMPSGRGWAGCNPKDVAEAIRVRLRDQPT